MARSRVVLSAAMVMAAALAVPLHAPPHAQEAGHVKVARGTVQIERAGQ